MVYVIAKNGQPLMPTKRYGKVRRLLKAHKAKVVHKCPFTIQLTYESTTHKQPVEVGDDTGSRHNGLSAVILLPDGRKIEVYVSEVLMRTDITDLLSTRREFRRARRNRTTRYRAPRFNNRVRTKNKGWLPPSIENKILTHLRELRFVCSILPVTKVTIETASFDLQKLKADLKNLKRPQGEEYQQGEQLDFWNVREYVLFRDGHVCQCCKGKSKDKILNVHHKESRKTGGNAPDNLVTLCEICHKGYHAGTVKLPDKIKRGTSFKDATFMGIMRWTFFNRVKEELSAQGIEVRMTYGYITKHKRIKAGLEKSHCIDARVISGHPKAEPLGYYFLKKKVRCHNRQIHKATIGKGGYRKPNQADRYVKGYKLYDMVRYNGRVYTVFGRRTSGFFDIRTLDGNKVNNGSVSYKKLKFIDNQQSVLVERRKDTA